MRRVALYVGGAVFVATATGLIALPVMRLVRGVLFAETLDGRLIALVLLAGILPAGIGVSLVGYALYQGVRRALFDGSAPEDDYFGRFLARRGKLDGDE